MRAREGSRAPRLFAAAAIVACASCATVPEWAGSIEELDGVVHVNNPADGLWSDREQPPIRFELEQVFGVELAPEEAIIGAVWSSTVDADANVYVLDRQPWHLVSFAPDGSVNWSAGREGEGPGELASPRGIAVHDGSLLLVNRGGTRIDRWTLDGEWVAGITLVEAGADRLARVRQLLGVVAPDTLVLEKTMWGATGTAFQLVRWGDPLESIAEFEVNVIPEDSLPQNFSGGVDAAVHGDAVIVGGQKHHAFRVFDGTGKPTRVVTRDVDFLRGPGLYRDGETSIIGGFGGLNAPIRLAGGYWLASLSWPTNVDDPDDAIGMSRNDGFRAEFNAALNLFDADGRFLYEILYEGARTPDIGRLLFVDADGNLYTALSDPFPQIRRYRVTIDE